LRALAIKAREDGKPLLADEITRLVIEFSDQADALERGKRQGEGELAAGLQDAASAREMVKRVRGCAYVRRP
jgi:hypothetical protein